MFAFVFFLCFILGIAIGSAGTNMHFCFINSRLVSRDCICVKFAYVVSPNVKEALFNIYFSRSGQVVFTA